jgi:hypothetical protein
MPKAVYIHGGVSPEIQFEIFAADQSGEIDVSTSVCTGPKFTVTSNAVDEATAVFVPLGNTSPISLVTGQTYFFGISVRRNKVNPLPTDVKNVTTDQGARPRPVPCEHATR